MPPERPTTCRGWWPKNEPFNCCGKYERPIRSFGVLSTAIRFAAAHEISCTFVTVEKNLEPFSRVARCWVGQERVATHTRPGRAKQRTNDGRIYVRDVRPHPSGDQKCGRRYAIARRGTAKDTPSVVVGKRAQIVAKHREGKDDA